MEKAFLKHADVLGFCEVSPYPELTRGVSTGKKIKKWDKGGLGVGGVGVGGVGKYNQNQQKW